ncbi:methylated-DNA--[protein]-cysteine S-methyltransferase [Methanobrevibacter oralis]|uniref:Methylated-DNA--protein-cysteine methyltransferase n=1 Tax=Methanobrevibacter oralis TaxID=66851 RepID=A0A166CA13_METOA|nr:methylated-DNA--[protein]-cysteine S-methyltransferase [Methanobrevibacter oralis]KZX14284.1 methylated-DNA--protein-cysteine methyltransferase [Methanobrevibacter oralis]
MYKSYYDSKLGKIILLSKNNKLTGLYFENQKYLPLNLDDYIKSDDLDIFVKTKELLDSYFKGEKVDFSKLDIALEGSDFRLKVWKILLKIPYGEVTTYGEIASKISKNMSAQAVGGAVAHNPISIIVGCHRVVGSDGSLTGYAGGIERKIELLELEKM